MAIYQQKQCFFCSQNIDNIDYKDAVLLKRYVSSQAKIIDPKYTGTCSRHQRSLAIAIKRSRFLGLLPFVG
jgi:small subunit ribosomal protein S18